MRRGTALLAVLAALAFGGAAQAQHSYTNPVLYADYSDPDVIRDGDAYYLVASSFHFSPGIPVLRSYDLVHWTIIGHVLPKLDFAPHYDMPGPFQLDDAHSKPVSGTRYASGAWAPSIRKHDGLFYVYWPTPDEGVYMATAKGPAGPWSPPVQVLKGPGYEDPCPLWDDDGTAWLIHGKVGAGPLILHRMSPDGTQVLDDGVVVAEDKQRLPVLEGPKFVKRDGWYYIFAPIGGVGTGPQAVGRSRTITGPYEWRDVLNPGNGLKGPHQGGYVETPSGQGWFIHFNQTGAFGRIDYLQPVRWHDGWPVMGDGGAPVLNHVAPDTGAWRPQDRLQDSDAFSGPALGLQWEWNHNPDDSRWSLSARSGFLRLMAGKADHLVTARNTLTQILQGPDSTITTRFDISGMQEGQRAGLVLFGVRVPWAGVVRSSGTTRVAYAVGGHETLGEAVRGDSIVLRAHVREDQTAEFSYSLDGRHFTPLGGTMLSRFSWWKGSRPGVFTYTTGDEGHVDVDWFRVSRGN